MAIANRGVQSGRWRKPDPNSDRVAFANCDSDSNSHSNIYCNGYGHSDTDIFACAYSETYSNSTTSSNTPPTSLAPMVPDDWVSW